MKSKKYKLVENGTTYYVTEGYYKFDDNYKYIHFFINKKRTIFHRENGPAAIIIDCDNNIVYERYIINNKIHRINGPAIIEYRFTKRPRKYFYLSNEFLQNIKSTKQLKKYIKLINIS